MTTERKEWMLRLAASVAALVFVCAGVARAHGPNGTLSEPAYEQMRVMAHDLDGLARHANDQAQHQGIWFYGHDRDFRRAIANFARRTSQFHARMDTYRTAAWQVDDELRGLLRDARAVQYRLEHSRYADDHTVADWNNTVRLLNQMLQVFQDDASGRFSQRRYTDDRYRAEPYGSRDQVEAGRGPYSYGTADLPSLAHELEQRASRVADASRQVASPSTFDPNGRISGEAIQHFAEQAAAFHDRVERGLTPDALRANVAHLVEDARAAGNQVRAENLTPQMRNDWNAVLQLVDRIRSVSGV
jgi:hypothetical protein